MKVLNHLQHLNPKLSYYGNKTRVQFTGSCLKRPKFTFTPKKVVNIYIVYELRAPSSYISDPTRKIVYLVHLL